MADEPVEDDVMNVRRCAHVDYGDDEAEVAIDVSVSWPAGLAPEKLKEHFQNVVDKMNTELSYLA